MEIQKNRYLEKMKLRKKAYSEICKFGTMQIWKIVNSEKCKFGKMLIQKNGNDEGEQEI